MIRPLLRMLALLAAVLLGFFVFLYFQQGSLIYFPSRMAEESLLERAQDGTLTPWRDAEGRRIGWRTRNGDAAHRLLVLHGNAGHALMRTQVADAFSRQEDGQLWQVFILEYPGYGSREGTPSEKSFLDAARNALEQLGGNGAFLLGESIGSGTACNLAVASPDRVRGLVLVTPFDSLASIASKHYPYVPARLLLRDRFDNARKLRTLQGIPVAILVAADDRVVPPESGIRLHDAANPPKRLWMLEGTGHNTVPYIEQTEVWNEVSNFILKN